MIHVIKDSMNTKISNFLTWSALAVVMGGAIVGSILVARENGGSGVSGTAFLADTVLDQDWFFGKKDARVVLVEYSDFQCPACAAYHPLVKKITEEFKNDLKFVYRHYPLAQHNNAIPAAKAAEAAGRQNKFWEMQDLLFANQVEWAESSAAEKKFEAYAAKIDLDLNQYKIDFKSDKVATKITNDYDSGNRSGVSYTPSFYLNGKLIKNPKSYDEFRVLIADAITES